MHNRIALLRLRGPDHLATPGGPKFSSVPSDQHPSVLALTYARTHNRWIEVRVASAGRLVGHTCVWLGIYRCLDFLELDWAETI